MDGNFSSNAEKTPMKFQFNGKATEYFSIWIVNIALTILTLGIYSAWAKVRNKQYFYGNTALEGASFQYLADPIKILKGRLIAFSLFATYSAFSYIKPLVAGYIFLGIMAMMPLFMVMSMSFRMRYTAWRNVRFGFVKNYKKAYLVMALPLIALGSYVFIALLFRNEAGDQNVNKEQVQQVLFMFSGMMGLMFLFFPLWDYMLNRFQISHSRFGKISFSYSATKFQYYKLYYLAILIFLFFLTATIVSAAALTYGIQEGFKNSSFKPDVIIPILLLFFILPSYLWFFSYLYAKKINLIFNNTLIGDHSLKSELKVLYIMYLFFTNTLAITLSLGLMTPWAKIRTARYRIKSTTLFVHGDLENIAAGEIEAQSAAGEEIGEIFDLDLGI